jgi:hypothetical protein
MRRFSPGQLLFAAALAALLLGVALTRSLYPF